MTNLIESHHVAWPWLWRLVGSQYRMCDWQLRLHHPQRPAWSQSQSSCPRRVDDQMGPWPCDQPSHSQSYRPYRSLRLGKYSCGSILVCLWFLSLCCEYCGLVDWVFLYDSLGHSGWSVEGWVKSHFIPLTWPDTLLSLSRWMLRVSFHDPSMAPFDLQETLVESRRKLWHLLGRAHAQKQFQPEGAEDWSRRSIRSPGSCMLMHVVFMYCIYMYCSCMVISWPLKACWCRPEDGEDRIFGSKELGKTLVLAADLGAEKQLQQDAWKNTLETRKDVGRWSTQQIEFISLEMNTANSWMHVLLLFTFTAVGPRMRCFIWPKWGN